MRRIEVSEETYQELLNRAESFEDTAEDVIVRLLGHHVPTDASGGRPTGRAAPGSILPEQAYWRPILSVIAEAGGRMAATDAIEAVWDLLKDELTPRDLERQRLGEMRWRNRVRFARLRMKERGLLSDASPRGVWEITDGGRRYLARAQ